MSWELREQVIEHGVDLGEKGKVARIVHLELALLADEDRIAHPGYERLMRVTQSSRATIARALKRLCAIGAVERVQRGGGVGVAAEYRVALPTVESVSPKRDSLVGEKVSPRRDSLDGESVSPRRDPRASQEGLKRVSPTRARVDASELTKPPLPPKGGRQRDRDTYDEELLDYARRHFPDRDPKAVAGQIKYAQRFLRLSDPIEIGAHVARMVPATSEAA